jgi:signal transduction histidine kinase
MTAKRHVRWSIWTAWSSGALTLALMGISWQMPEMTGLPALSLYAGTLMSYLSVLAVLLAAGWHRRAAGLGWPWLLLALAFSVQGWSHMLEVVPTARAPVPESLLHIVVISLASLTTVAGPARIWAEQARTVGNTLQRTLESGILTVVALIVLNSPVHVTLPPVSITPALVIMLISDSLFLGGLIPLLVVAHPMTRYLGAASLISLALTRLAIVVMAEQASEVMPITIGPWVLLALASAYCAGPAPPQGDPWTRRERDDCWRGTILVQISLVLGLGSALVWPLPSPTLVIGLLTLALIYAGCLHLRHQATMRRWRQHWQHEQATFQRTHATDQQHLHALARLIHDLGSPVQGVSSIADQLLRIATGDLRESPRTISERLGRHADYLEHLIRQLAAHLRHQQPTAPRRTRIDVMIIATTVVESHQFLARHRAIDLSLALGTEATEILGDAHAVRRMLENLVSNALAVTPPHGIIVVELWIDRAHPGALTISVRDTGPGLTEPDHHHVFLPQDQRHRGPGMGLGLAIVADLTASLGGTYGVTSQPGAGSTFWVRLPRDEEEQR